MCHINKEWMPPYISEKIISICIQRKYPHKNTKTPENMSNTISDQIDTEPWENRIIIRWEISKWWVSHWYQKYRLQLRCPDIWTDYYEESNQQEISSEYEKQWWEKHRKCKEMHNSPRYPNQKEKTICHKWYTESQASKYSCSSEWLCPYLWPRLTIWAKIERYSSKCDEECDYNFPEIKPEYLRKIQDINRKKRNEHIIGMKKYHPYDSYSSQSIDFSESMIHSYQYTEFL